MGRMLVCLFQKMVDSWVPLKNTNLMFPYAWRSIQGPDSSYSSSLGGNLLGIGNEFAVLFCFLVHGTFSITNYTYSEWQFYCHFYCYCVIVNVYGTSSQEGTLSRGDTVKRGTLSRGGHCQAGTLSWGDTVMSHEGSLSSGDTVNWALVKRFHCQGGHNRFRFKKSWIRWVGYFFTKYWTKICELHFSND